MTTSESLVIAIDGPAGAGKSTAARLLAEALGFEFLDTGAMYRCVTLTALESGVALDDATRIADIARTARIELNGTQVHMNGRDVSEAIRDPLVSSSIGKVADNPAVRSALSELQRQWAGGRRAVSEGRDQGTEVFPDSPCKIFLTASPEERARRRCQELIVKGISATYDEILAQQSRRDLEDRSRPLGSLRQANDAVLVLTDGLTMDEVIERLLAIVESKTGFRRLDAASDAVTSHPHSAPKQRVAESGQ